MGCVLFVFANANRSCHLVLSVELVGNESSGCVLAMLSSRLDGRNIYWDTDTMANLMLNKTDVSNTARAARQTMTSVPAT